MEKKQRDKNQKLEEKSSIPEYYKLALSADLQIRLKD